MLRQAITIPCDEAMGKSREQYVLEAQSKTKNAHAASVQAAFNLFKVQLEEDQAAFEAFTIRQVGFESALFPLWPFLHGLLDAMAGPARRMPNGAKRFARSLKRCDLPHKTKQNTGCYLRG